MEKRLLDFMKSISGKDNLKWINSMALAGELIVMATTHLAGSKITCTCMDMARKNFQTVLSKKDYFKNRTLK